VWRARGCPPPMYASQIRSATSRNVSAGHETTVQSRRGAPPLVPAAGNSTKPAGAVAGRLETRAHENHHMIRAAASGRTTPRPTAAARPMWPSMDRPLLPSGRHLRVLPCFACACVTRTTGR
jgi:hypothetical protein